MRMSWPLLDATLLTDDLNTTRVGRSVRVLAETTSTNDVAFDVAASGGGADGLAVFAEYQTGGRGRQGRTWLAPRGASVLCSVLLFAPDDMAFAGLLTLAAGVAACDAIRETTTAWPVLRWPNDVFVGGRKIAGVLVESRPAAGGRRAWVVGTGINCYQHAEHFPPELRDRATSLELASPEPIDRLRLARQLLRELDRWLAPGPASTAETVRCSWLERAEPLGQRIRLVSEGRTFAGITLDVDPQEGLLVQLDEGARRWFDASRTQVV